jgi:hypothetical protein
MCDRKQLVDYQKNDTNLDKVRSYVIDEPQDTQSKFIYNSDLLYRVYEKPNGEVLHHNVVPQQLRSTVLSLGHDILLAGHLGNKQTRDRIMQHFFWPGIFNGIAEYCRSCPECQLGTAKGRVLRAPLVSTPPIDKPFQRIALDFVGPLPLSENKKAESVANAILSLFSRVGIPKELLTDQGSNFMSELMQEERRLLKIGKLRTSPYHAMSNGLCEIFNGVLKKIIGAYARS